VVNSGDEEMHVPLVQNSIGEGWLPLSVVDGGVNLVYRGKFYHPSQLLSFEKKFPVQLQAGFC